MLLDISKAILTVLFVITLESASYALEIKSSYTTIVYEEEGQLRKFDRRVYLGSLSYLLQRRSSVTITDEIKNKVDVIIEKVESILGMYPKTLEFKIVLLSSDADVQRIYYDKYKIKSDYIAFYSPQNKTVFISVNAAELTVLAHEITHAVVDQFFGFSTPVKVHEVLAQYVETHIDD